MQARDFNSITRPKITSGLNSAAKIENQKKTDRRAASFDFAPEHTTRAWSYHNRELPVCVSFFKFVIELFKFTAREPVTELAASTHYRARMETQIPFSQHRAKFAVIPRTNSPLAQTIIPRDPHT